MPAVSVRNESLELGDFYVPQFAVKVQGGGLPSLQSMIPEPGHHSAIVYAVYRVGDDEFNTDLVRR